MMDSIRASGEVPVFTWPGALMAMRGRTTLKSRGTMAMGVSTSQFRPTSRQSFRKTRSALLSLILVHHQLQVDLLQGRLKHLDRLDHAARQDDALHDVRRDPVGVLDAD